MQPSNGLESTLSAGYVYALINTSLDGLVKVGRTERAPEERALELSRATGVPTPFIVAYQKWVPDCASGEVGVHSFLEMRGFRINENREFFRAPLHIVVEAISTICSTEAMAITNQPGGENPSVPTKRKPYTRQQLNLINDLKSSWRSAVIGMDSYPDFKAAIRSARQLIALGEKVGHQMLGDAILKQTSDPKAAETAYREGALAGSVECMWSIADLRDRQGQKAEADHAWGIFFDHADDLVNSIHEEVQRTIPTWEGYEGYDLQQIAEVVDDMMFTSLRFAFIDPVFEYFLLRISSNRPLNQTWLKSSYVNILRDLFIIALDEIQVGEDLETDRVAAHVRKLLAKSTQ